MTDKGTDARIYIQGSYGMLVIDKLTGRVLVDECDYEDDDTDGYSYRHIIEVDVKEFAEFYGASEYCDTTDGDILDWGYWSRHEDGKVTYIPPCMDWREDYLNM